MASLFSFFEHHSESQAQKQEVPRTFQEHIEYLLGQVLKQQAQIKTQTPYSCFQYKQQQEVQKPLQDLYDLLIKCLDLSPSELQGHYSAIKDYCNAIWSGEHSDVIDSLKKFQTETVLPHWAQHMSLK